MSSKELFQGGVCGSAIYFIICDEAPTNFGIVILYVSESLH